MQQFAKMVRIFDKETSFIYLADTAAQQQPQLSHINLRCNHECTHTYIILFLLGTATFVDLELSGGSPRAFDLAYLFSFHLFDYCK